MAHAAEAPRTFAPVKECIYCGAREKNPGAGDALGEEHIVPLSLGGKAVLPEASCAACEAITSKNELRIGRQLWPSVRAYYGYPTRRPHRRPKTMPVRAQTKEGTEVELQVPLSRHPGVFAVTMMNTPEIFPPVQDDVGDRTIDVIYPRGIGETEELLRQLAVEHEVDVVVPPRIVLNPDAHRLLLAKIAHAIAVARLGLHGFDAFLPGLIRSSDGEGLKRFVGRSSLPRRAEGDGLHHLTGVITEDNLLVVQVGLYFKIGMPPYDVVAGRAPVGGAKCRLQQHPTGAGGQ